MRGNNLHKLTLMYYVDEWVKKESQKLIKTIRSKTEITQNNFDLIAFIR